jgi:hypothetical protein
MSSEPGVKSLLRLTADHIAAYENHRSGALLERLPKELQDLISDCASQQLQEKSTSNSALFALEDGT